MFRHRHGLQNKVTPVTPHSLFLAYFYYKSGILSSLLSSDRVSPDPTPSPPKPSLGSFPAGPAPLSLSSSPAPHPAFHKCYLGSSYNSSCFNSIPCSWCLNNELFHRKRIWVLGHHLVCITTANLVTRSAVKGRWTRPLGLCAAEPEAGRGTGLGGQRWLGVGGGGTEALAHMSLFLEYDAGKK